MLSLIFSDEFSTIERKVLQTAAHVAFKELGIAQRDASIHVMRASLPGETVGGVTQTGDDSYLLVLSHFNEPQQDAFAVGHECVHIWQYLRGDLVAPNGADQTVYWKGELHQSVSSNEDKQGYLDLPWEKEAHGLHMPIFKKICTAIPKEDREAASAQFERRMTVGVIKALIDVFA